MRDEGFDAVFRYQLPRSPHPGRSDQRGHRSFSRDTTSGTVLPQPLDRVEFASLIAREVRMGGLAAGDALLAIGQFDELVADSFQVLMLAVLTTSVQSSTYRTSTASYGRRCPAPGYSQQQWRQDTVHLGRGLLNAANLLTVPQPRYRLLACRAAATENIACPRSNSLLGASTSELRAPTVLLFAATTQLRAPLSLLFQQCRSFEVRRRCFFQQLRSFLLRWRSFEQR